jgi:hypothetical protein
MKMNHGAGGDDKDGKLDVLSVLVALLPVDD